MNTNNVLELLTSYQAIMVYEIILILVCVFFISKLKKEEKLRMEILEETEKKDSMDHLDSKLSNKHKGEKNA